MGDILHTHVTDADGDPLVVRALGCEYLANGAPGIVLWPCDGEGLLTSEEPWCTATVNGVWPTGPGVVVLDSNDMGRQLTDDLLAWGPITDTGMRARSGYCAYPVCTVDGAWYDALAGVDDVDGPEGERLFSPELVDTWR